MKTIYHFNNSNGSQLNLDASEAADRLRRYPLRYYSLANDCNGGKGFGTHRDMLGGVMVHVVCCRIDDGTTKGCWLSANAGTEATASRILAEWQAIKPAAA